MASTAVNRDFKRCIRITRDELTGIYDVHFTDVVLATPDDSVAFFGALELLFQTLQPPFDVMICLDNCELHGTETRHVASVERARMQKYYRYHGRYGGTGSVRVSVIKSNVEHHIGEQVQQTREQVIAAILAQRAAAATSGR